MSLVLCFGAQNNDLMQHHLLLLLATRIVVREILMIRRSIDLYSVLTTTPYIGILHQYMLAPEQTFHKTGISLLHVLKLSTAVPAKGMRDTQSNCSAQFPTRIFP